jgi:hypothetical protein
MEDPKGTFGVPSIIWKTSLFFSSLISLYASYFAFVKAKQCWFLSSKGLSLEPPSCLFIYYYDYYYFGTNGHIHCKKETFQDFYLFIYLSLIIIILTQMEKSIVERKPSKILILILVLFIYFGTNGKIHCRMDTFQDFQQHIHSTCLISCQEPPQVPKRV